MRKILLALFMLLPAMAGAQQLVNCATGVPCTPTGPQNTGTGDPAWMAFGKVNADVIQLYQNTPTLPLSIANGGNGTSSPLISAGSNVTISGTWPNYVISTAGSGAGNVVGSGSITSGHCVQWTGAYTIVDAGATCGSGGGSAAFSALTSSTNISAAMLVGAGASLGPTGGGTVTANVLSSGIALGTPASGNLANATALPLTSGVSGILPVASGGNGTATPNLVAGTNITISGSWPAITINSTASGSGNVVGSGGVTSGHCVQWTGAFTVVDSGAGCGSGGSTAFSALTTSTNTSAAMTVGTGGSMLTSGSGTIAATSAPLSGVSGLGTGVATWLAAPSSANLAAAMTDETGSGALVFATSPTFTTGVTLGFVTGSTQCLQASTAGLISGTGSACGSGGSTAFSAITAGTNAAALVMGTGGSFTTSGTGTITATAVPVAGISGLATGMATFMATPTSANLAATLTNETGTGLAVFNAAPALTSPTIGTGATLGFITGSTQCVQVNTSGVVSGTGASCGGSLSAQADQTVLGNGSGASAVPVALTLGGNLKATATTLITSQTINAQTGTSYALLTTDAGKLITASNAASQAYSLSVATTAGFTAGYSFDIQNKGAGTVTITPTTSTINGASTLVIATNQGCTVTSDGTNYQVSACTASAAGGGSGTVNSGTTGQIPFYASSGNSIGPVPGPGNLSYATGTLFVGTGSGIGNVSIHNATTGSVTQQVASTSSTTDIATFPGNTGTIAELNLAQTWTAAQNIEVATRTVTTSPTVVAGDMGGQINSNVSGGGTLTIPAISGTVFASGMILDVVNYSASTELVTTTPGINAGGGCVSGTGIPAGYSWQMISNGTTIDCNQTATGNITVVTASSATSVTPNCSYRLVDVTASTTGTFTVNAPTGCTPTDGQILEVDVLSPAGGTITYAFNATFEASATVSLPTTSNAASKEDDFLFHWSARQSKWKFMSANQGF